LRGTAAALLFLAVALVSGRGRTTRALDAKGGSLPPLGRRCGTDAAGVTAKVGWFRATDGILLDGASLGDGKTGIVLAHESPADLCGWLPYAKVLGAAGFRVLAFDQRHFGLSQSPIAADKCGRFSKDLAGAVAELEHEGAKKVFLMGASFGGITSMVAVSRLGSKVAGVISVSGEKQLANRCGPAAELDALDAVPRLRAPLLILGSREDGFLPPSDARALLRRAGSPHKRLVLFPGGDHGWDILENAPYRARANAVVQDFLQRYE
jgi:pimeloyl-ACP methyl ester carboxylesterase